MTNFHDPKIVQADAFAFVKLIYVVGGVYIWEFLSSLWFEWQIITGKRSYRWSIWLYSGCRFSALFAIVTLFIGFNMTTPINCRVWLVCVLLFTYLGCALASALIVLRIIAIWERQRLPCTFAVAIWLLNISFYIRNMIKSAAIRDSQLSTCIIIKTNRNTTSIVLNLGENLALAVLMFVGLRRYKDVGLHGLWQFLHHQGIFWLVLVIVAELPTTVFIILNLNGYFNQMFRTPGLIVMTIGVSRIYRDLSEFTRKSYYNRVNESFHGAATSHPSLMDIQLNRLSQSNSLSNSLSHNRLCGTHLRESSQPYSSSQAGLHRPDAHFPFVSPPLTTHFSLPPLPPAVHSPPGLPPPAPPPPYPPPMPPSPPPSPSLPPPPPPPSLDQTHSHSNLILQSQSHACLQRSRAFHRPRSYSQADLRPLAPIVHPPLPVPPPMPLPPFRCSNPSQPTNNGRRAVYECPSTVTE